MTDDVEKVSLLGAQIIMSYRESDEERRTNLYAVLNHIGLTYRDYSLWLMEADSQPRFDWNRLANANIRHVFVPDTGPFPKALLYNIAVRASRGEVLCFHDADSIASPAIMAQCAQLLLEPDEAEAVAPFYSVVNLGGELKSGFLIDPRYDLLANIPDEDPKGTSIIYRSAPGGITFFRREAYCRVGGYNAAFRGWGGEDDEMLYRARRLGLRWHSIVHRLIHLNHGSSERDSLIGEAGFRSNRALAEASRDMPMDGLEALSRSLSQFFA